MLSLGIDESYTQTGIAIVKGNNSKEAQIILADAITFKECKTKTEKRNKIKSYIEALTKKYNIDIIVIERIRLFSQQFLSQDYIKSTAALTASIVDVVYPQKVFSADTASWKARICGSKKGQKKNDKDVSVRYVFNRFGYVFNDDISDAICISLYGLDYEKNKKLLKEEA